MVPPDPLGPNLIDAEPNMEGQASLKLDALAIHPARRRLPKPMLRPYELFERIKRYNPDVDTAAIDRAYVFSMKAHGTQQRASGDTYFSHPLEVAGILTEMKLDDASIITALLHDTLEDTVATSADLSRLFGEEIARLVEGVTKLSRIELQSEQAKQAENFRKLLIAMSEDIRVLLVKLADRLHNMRTLNHIPKPEKRARIARETLEIYAPLAERIGIEMMQKELEELAFAELYPEACQSIHDRLRQLRDTDVNLVERIIEKLDGKLKANGITAQIEGREKSPYSIWRKMQRKNVTLEQLSDIMAFRVLVDSVEHCYQALGAIHGGFPVVPGRFKDYISTPKPNGYQSLHTAVIGPFGNRVEMQIRTRTMHEVCELGVAAHWAYKQGDEAGKTEGRQYRWLRELLDIVEQAQKPEEFLEHTKLALFREQVFCFSPKGDLIELPRGATPLDFAYAVHTKVGDHCAGAKVNGRMVPLRTVLENGDQVEIVTSKTAKPSPAWERLAVTGKARACIRKYIRTTQRTEYVALGRQLLLKLCQQEGQELSEKMLEPILGQFQAQSVEDLYVNLGAALQSPRDVFNVLFPSLKPKPVPFSLPSAPQKPQRKKTGGEGGQPLEIKGLIPGMAVHYARCCHPLTGDRIVGIVATGRGVTVHTIDCETLGQFQNQPEKWIDVSWGDETAPEKMVGRIMLTMANRTGALGNITTLIGKQGANITNLKIMSRSAEFFDIVLDIEVSDTRHLMNVMAVLRSAPVIVSVERMRGR